MEGITGINVEDDSGTQTQIVQTDTTGLHEQKIYNQLRDQIWGYVDVLQMNPESIAQIIRQIKVLLTRADSLWREIDKAFEVKKRRMQIKEIQKIYNGELLDIIAKMDQILVYLKYINERQLPTSLQQDQEFMKIQEKPIDERYEYLASKVVELVSQADGIWGNSAVNAGLNLPISVREERQQFFRAYGKVANTYKRW